MLPCKRSLSGFSVSHKMIDFLLTSNIDLRDDIPGDIYYISSACFYGKSVNRNDEIVKRILPTPFNDEELEKSFKVIEDTYGRIIKKISLVLNKIHGTNFSDKYWDGLLTAWLIYFIALIYEKYLRLKNANSLISSKYRIIVPQKIPIYIPENDIDFFSLLDYNYYDTDFRLYSKIAESMSLSTHEIQYKFEVTKPDIDKIYIIDKLMRFLGSAVNKFAVLKNTVTSSKKETPIYLPFANNIYFKTISRFNSNLRDVKNIKIKSNVINNKTRSLLSAIETESDFEQCIVNLIPEYLPKTYIEYYEEIRKTAIAYTKSQAIFFNTQPAWHENLTYSFAAFESREKNDSKLIHIQHGGGDGQYKYFLTEFAKRRVIDVYISWGWKDDYYQGAQIVPLPDMKLSHIKSSKSYVEKNIKALFMSTSGSPYLYRNNYWTTAEGFENYFKKQFEFFSLLDREIASDIVYRPCPIKYYKWDNIASMKKRFPYLNIDVNGESIDVMLSSELIILDHFSTSILEAFALNIPTVCYWDPEFYSCRDSSIDIFNKLRRCEILHSEPISAAGKIKDIWDDTDGWWFDNSIQEVVEEFVANFVICDHDYKNIWKRGINSISN